MSKEYILYHIPGKKIGCTTDLYNRVTEQQGYEPGEYEVIEKSNDIDYISKREIQLQEEYGYRIDRVPYNKLNMCVTMRSNDLWYGFCNDQYCFSRLQLLISKELNIEIGTYYHFAHNLHLYNNIIKKINE